MCGLQIGLIDMNQEVLDFINRRWQEDCHWLDGNCYWFAHILHTRFSILEIYYLPIEGHFICGDGKNFYDWSGYKIPKEEPWLFSDIAINDPLWFERIVRDCVK